MENRRDFFKAVGLFAAGVVGARIASYTPKKQEEELQVAESLSVRDQDGNEYNMVVVPKKKEEPVRMPKSSSFDSGERIRVNSNGSFAISGTPQPEPVFIIHQSRKLRKLNS